MATSDANATHTAGTSNAQRLGLWLFSAPFIGFGLFSIWAGFSRAFEGSADEPIFFVLFGAVFAGIGFGIPYLAKRVAEKKALNLREHPDAPWMWNKAWRSGRIDSGSRAELVIAWIFAIAFGGAAAPIVWVALPEELAKGNSMILVGLLFPAAAVGLAVWAVRTTLRYRRFGVSTFEMHTFPGIVGGHVKGAVQMRAQTAPDDGFEYRVSCVRRRTTGSGKNRSTHETTKWEHVERVRRESAALGPYGLAIPIDVAVPYDCKPSDAESSDDYIVWRMTIDGEYPGVDYAASFEIPVFLTPESSPEIRESTQPAAVVHEDGDRLGVVGAQVQIRPWGANGRELYYPAFRHKGTALSILVMGGIFGGVAFLPVPLLFEVVFGGFGALIGLFGVVLGLRTTRVRADTNGIWIRRAMLGIGRNKHLPIARIQRVEARIGMEANRRAFYDVIVLSTDEEPEELRAGSYIPDKRAAEAIMELMREALRL